MKTYPLLQSQLGIFLEWLQMPSMTKYNLPTLTPFPKSITVKRIEQMLRRIIDARPELHTRFMLDEDGNPRQYCDHSMEIPILIHKMSEEEAKDYIDNRFVRPYDPLGNQPLCRMEIIDAPKYNYMLLEIHHTIGDGLTLSPNLTIKDIPAAYYGNKLEEINYDMYQYAEDEEATIGSEQYQRAADYYREKFAGLDFANLTESNADAWGNSIRESAYIPVQQVDDWCKEHGTSSNLLFMAAFSLVVSRLTREQRVAYHALNHGRMDKRLMNAYGMFVHSVPILADVDSKQPVIDFIKGFRRELMSTIRYGVYPFNHFCRDLKMTPNISFGFQGVSMQEFVELDGLHIQSRQLPKGLSDEPLACIIYLKEGNYEIRLDASDAQNSRERLRMLANAIQAATLSMMQQADELIGDISIIGEKEKEDIMEVSAGKQLEVDITKTFAQVFEERAKLVPNNIAVADKNSSLTYFELSRRSNILAHQLVKSGVQPNDFVCVMLDRFKEFPLSVLAIHKAGAAYTPMDFEYPNERLQYMLENSESKVLITSHAVLETKKAEGDFETNNVQIIFIEDIDFSVEAKPINLTTPDNLAYMIYTSGSTGKPKGAMLHQAGLWNFINVVIDMEKLTAADRIEGHRSFSFDAHIEDMYAILTLGGSFHIMPTDIRKDLAAIRDFLFEHQITGGGYSTAIAALLLNTYDDLPVRFITAGGEKLDGVYSDHIEIINVYGPTECTDDTSYYSIAPGERVENIPIGKPVANTWNFIVDDSGHLVPRGMMGELCIAGIQVGRGYWRLPERTAQSFVDCPFIKKDRWGRKVRMYHTGDLCRWNEQGDLEYMGRIDFQVKLRGFRIELGEIESKVLQLEGILQAAAEVKKVMGTEHLILYYTLTEGAEVTDDSIRQALEESSLADYMVPDTYMKLDVMPITPNGKINRKQLPLPEIKSDTEYVEPEGATEKAIAEGFASVLGLSIPVGALDSFYALGGDSIKSIRLVSLLRKEGISLQVPQIMKLKTVRAIAAAASDNDLPQVSQEAWSGTLHNSAIVQYFFDLELPKPEHFNQAVMLCAQTSVDEEDLRQSLQALVIHHDMLRAVVANGQLEIRTTDAENLYAMKVYDFRGHADARQKVEQAANELNASINLQEGPIFKTALMHCDRNDYLLLVAHHLVVDGVSWRIIAEDLNTVYQQALHGTPIELAAKTHSYKDYVEGLNHYKDSYILKKETEYWDEVRKQMQTMPMSNGCDYSRTFESLDISLDNAKTHQLLTETSRAFNTEINDLLLTALGRAYQQQSGRDMLSIQLEGHGREPIGEPLFIDRTVGWFTSIFPVVLTQLGGDLSHDLRHVKETLRHIPNKGLGYGQLYGMDILMQPLVCFNYLGEFGNEATKDITFVPTSDLGAGQMVATENTYGPGLTIDAMVNNGTLQVHFKYDTDIWGSDKAQDLANAFVCQLNDIINLTTSCEQAMPTASDLGELEWNDEEFTQIYQEFEARGEHLSRIYPLTPMQEGMVLKAVLEPESVAYRLVFAVEMNMLPSEQQLRSALDSLAERHEVLRTSVIYRGVHEYRQAIVNGRQLGLTMMDISGEDDKDKAIADIRKNLLNSAFDLQSKPLFNMVCLKTSDTSCTLLLVFHHIIEDGWCLPIIQKDFFNMLADEIAGKLSKVESTGTGRYENYVRNIRSKDNTASLAYWSNLLEGYEAQAVIPSFGTVKEEYQTKEDSLITELSLDEQHALNNLCQATQTTPNTVVELAWGLLLQRYNHVNDAVFAKIVSGRDNTNEDVSDVIGIFINTVPVRIKIENDDTVLDALQRVQAQAVETNKHDYLSMSEVQQQSELGTELYQSTVVFENYPSEEAPAQSWPFVVKPVITKEENFDDISLTVFIGEDGRMALQLQFNNQKYSEQLAKDTLHTLHQLVRGIIANADEKIANLMLLDKETEKDVLKLSAGERKKFNLSKTFIESFIENAKATPEAIAVVDSTSHYTYGELDQHSNALAHRLIAEGVKPNTFVCVLMERRKEFVLAVHAIHKVGAAYSPLDVDYPVNRLQYMLENSESKVLLTSRDVLAEKQANGLTIDRNKVKVILLDEIDLNSQTEPVCLTTPDNLAYMIYTSGSTGKPKGVMLHQRGLMNLICTHMETLQLTASDRIASHRSFSFDAHVDDLFPILFAGGELHIMPSDIRKDLGAIQKFLVDHKITGFGGTTSLMMLLINDYELPLRFITAGGEKLSGVKSDKMHIVNLYGPTECTNDSTLFVINPGDEYENIPIGRPLPNTNSYITDQFGNLLPQGIPGELCISGVQVGYGYWHLPEQTEKVFVDNPFGEGTLYHTGDLARYNEDGQIEYLGRIDGQVKLRGFRIELGEIEANAMQHPAVRQAAALVKEVNESRHLVLYYTQEEGKQISHTELAAHLDATSLAKYMMPEIYMPLDAMPLLPNGKINRKALPTPEVESGENVAPATETEKQLYEIAVELLKTDQFGVTTNLISIGMTSLSAMRYSAQLSQKYGLKIPTKDILATPFIRKLAKIQEVAADAQPEVDYSLRSTYPLTENQRGVYVDWDMNREALQYNIPFVVDFTGKDGEQLKKALEAVVEAHPYLKTRLVRENGDVRQQRRDDAPVTVSLTKLDKEPTKDFFRSRLLPFNLFTDDLYRFEIYQAPYTLWLFMDIHHIIYDGASSFVLMQDLRRAYNGEKLEKEEYTAFERALDEEALKGTSTWKEAEAYFDQLLPGIEMAVYPHSDVVTGSGNQELSLTFDGSAISEFCQKYGVTVSNYFLTALMQVLHRTTREESIYITSIDNGRTDVRMMNIMGMFVKTLPVVSNFTTEEAYKKSMAEAVTDMQKQFVETQGRSFYPFTEMVERHGIRPEIMYAYQGSIDDAGMEKEEAIQLDTVKMPLSVSIYPEADGKYTIALEYDGGLYGEADMRQLAQSIANFSVSAASANCLANVSLLSAEEEHHIALQSTGQQQQIDPNETFVSIFMQRAAENPDAPAVVDELGQYTYGQLNALTAAVAKKLVALGVKPYSFVSIMLGYQKEFLVAAIAVEKAGGAYVPLDYDYPNERLLYMLEDSESQVLITSHAIFMEKNADGEFKAKNIFFIDDYIQGITIDKVDTTLNHAIPDGLAYMIYTSGSTGKPKGVMISHKAKANFVQFIAREWRHTSKSRICCHSSFSFDASIEDLYPVLTVGGTLYTVPQDARKDLTLLHDFIINNGITGGCYTTQLGQMLLQLFPDLPVDYLVVGGEKMTVNPDCKCRLINTYGPTEFTVDATFFELEKGKEYKNIPIGRPLYNLSAYVVDPCGHLLPQGMAGELCMAGPQIASGYWKREDLTAEKFANMTIDGQQVKVYHTGDLVRYNADQQIEYMGRIDSQVKLRGFRIELGEIETLIGNYESIQMESVQVREIGGVQHLCAYYTADKEIDKEALRNYLAEQLTDYMVPTAYIQLDEMPLTPNGKVNTKVLPNPSVGVEEFVSPESPTEEKLFKMASETLKHDQFGVTTNLITMGLTSLSAMRFTVAIHIEFGVEITVKDVLQNPVIRDIATIIDGKKGQTETPMADNTSQLSPFTSHLYYYPITENQRGVFFDWEMNRDTTQYNVPEVHVMKGGNAEKLHEALVKVIDAHPYLKTRFVQHEGDIMQIRRDEEPAEILMEALAEKPDTAFFQSRIRPFDLYRDTLYRLEIYTYGGDVYLFIDIHHSIYDGASSLVLLSDIDKAYHDEEVKSESYTAFDFALDELRLTKSEKYTEAENYFKGLLDGLTTAVYPHSKELNGVAEGNEGHLSLTVSGQDITMFCQQEALTPNSYFLTVLMHVLHSVTREDDITITTINNGRADVRMMEIMGMFVKTLPVVSTSADGLQSIATVAKKIQNQVLETQSRDFYPFTKMVELYDLRPEIMFVYQPSGGEENENDAINLTLNQSKLPLTIKVTPNGKDEYDMELEYDNSLYSKKDMERLGAMLKQVSEQALTATKLSEVSLLSPDEEKAMTDFCKGKHLDVDINKTFIQLFTETAQRIPDKLAVADENSQFTYRELSKKSDALAHCLIENGVCPDDFVCVMLERCKEFILCVHAIHKAAAAYAPLDIDYPSDRLQYMIEDCQAKVLLTTHAVFENKCSADNIEIDESHTKIIFIDDLQLDVDCEPICLAKPENLAYMIYTSGSTGKPKGTMLHQAGLMNCVEVVADERSITENDRVGVFYAFSFDAHVVSIYPVLLRGGSLFIMPSSIRKDMEMTVEFIRENKITEVGFPTAIGSLIVLNYPELPLRLISMGGERMDGLYSDKYTIVNAYGPTECTCEVTYFIVEPGHHYDTIPIGRPTANNWGFVTDKYGRLLPVGIAGEFCFAGIQIGRGYWNLPEKTAEVFGDCPFVSEDHWGRKVRMYHTGDMVRYREDGELEFIGRIDNQVKLRGFRIELGEIENRSMLFDGIKQVAVMVKKVNGAEHLCLYYTETKEVDVSLLKQHLSESLAEYMVPDAYMRLDVMPMTPNGKINRKALPLPVIKAEEIVAPENEMEKELLDIAFDLLKNDQFGVTTNLISMGITSLLAMRFSSIAKQKLNLHLPTKDILQHPTVRELAALTGTLQEQQISSYEKRDYYPLTENQRGVYIDWELNRGTTQYNIPFVKEFSDISAEQLRNALVETIEAHAYMKTRLTLRHDDVAQLRRDDATVTVTIEQTDCEPDTQFFQSQIRPFDLFNDDLYRLKVYQTPTTVWLFMDMHHIIFDGGSGLVFLRDLNRALNGETLEKEQFSAFDQALYEQSMTTSVQYMEAEGYFDEMLASAELAIYPRSTKDTTSGNQELQVTIERRDIESWCRQNSFTESNFFMTVLLQVLHRTTREEQLYITTIDNGRSETNLLDCVGMFVKTLPVTSTWEKPLKAENMSAAVKKTQEQFFNTKANSFYPFTKMVERHNIRPEIMYVYQGGLEGGNNQRNGDAITLALDTAKLPITMTVYPTGTDNYALVLEYDGSLYNQKDMSRLASALRTFAMRSIETGDLNAISLLDDEATAEVLVLSKGKDLKVDISKTFANLFTEQACRTPNAPAVVDKESQLTYAVMDSYSNLIAHKLVEIGIKPNDFVCILLDRMKEFPLSVLGIHKAGAAYTPLDFEYPNDRLLYMLENSEAKVMITTHAVLEAKKTEGEFNVGNVTIFYIDDFMNSDDVQGLTKKKVKPIDLSSPDGLAYMIYTSGSTGKPKGAMLHQAGLRNFISVVIDMEKLTADDRISGHRSFSFDAHIEDMYPILTLGGSFHIMSTEIRKDLGAIRDFLFKHKITGGGYSTAITCLLLNTFDDLPIRFITGGGEKMAGVYSDHIEIINVYGPTECTDDTSYYAIAPGQHIEEIPIGKSVANNWNFIIDDAGQLLPQGVAGELCFAGIQVGRGYWRLPERTAQSFVDCPFVSEDQWGRKVRMYHTGDLCRWNEDGELEYISRIDTQVKLRGYRIELGEIEKCAKAFEGMISVVADVKTVNGTQHLCLYYTADRDIDTEALRENMSQTLTDYMVPETFVKMESMPMTPNGKIDRKKLPIPDIKQETEGIPPSTKREQKLFDIVKELLGHEDFGVTDNLMRLGMTSLLVIRMVAKACTEGILIKVDDFMRTKSIRAVLALNQQLMAWHKEPDATKPVAVLVQGETRYNDLIPYMEKLEERYNVLTVEAITTHFEYLFKEDNINEAIEFYYTLLDVKLLEAGINKVELFTGHCFGADLSYRLAVRWQQDYPDQKPNVCMLDSFWVDQNRQLKRPQLDLTLSLLPESMQKEIGVMSNEQDEILDMYSRLNCQGNPAPLLGKVILISAAQKENILADLSKKLRISEEQILSMLQMDSDQLRKAIIPQRELDNVALWKQFRSDLLWQKADGDHMSMLSEACVASYIQFVFDNIQ